MRAAGIVLVGLVSASVWAQPTAGDQTGSISGTVRDSITKMPVNKATIMANPIQVQSTSTNAGRSQASAVTDAGGTFAIGSLNPGRYQLVIQHQNYPQARLGGVMKIAEVKAGDSAAPIEVELTPGASLSGRVLDEDGEPLQGCSVQPRLPKNPDQGVPMSGNSNTNEDGEYRLYSIAPGKYILMAQCRAQIFQPRPFSAGPDRPPARAYPVQYYPLTTEPKAAEVVELFPGTEKTGVDFRMRPAPVTQIHGVIAPGSAEWKGFNMNIQLRPVDRNMRNGMTTGANLNQANGTFEFRQVFPGSYLLVAFSNDNEEKRVGAMQRIEVTDEPLAVALELRHSVDVSGKVEYDAASVAAANANAASNGPGSARVVAGLSISGPNSRSFMNVGVLSPSQVHIQLVPMLQIGMPIPQTQANEDGSFTLKGVIPGTWRLQVNGNGFVKWAWLGSADVTNAPIDLSNGAAGPLRIVMSTNMGSIHGTAPAGMNLTAVRIDDEVPYLSTRGAQVDPSGQYRMEGMAPGKYRLVLMQSFGPTPDEGGQEVTVHEGETVTIDLKAPAEP